MMNHWLRPVGPHPAEVYWLRRAGVVVLGVLIIVLLWSAVGSLVGGGADAQTSLREQVDPQSDDEAVDGAVPATQQGFCAKSDLNVAALVSEREVKSGSSLRLDMKITNVSSDSCVVDAGTRALELIVHRGDDVVWSSDHCQKDPSSVFHEVDPGQALSSGLTWGLVTSDLTCSDKVRAVSPGKYALVARIGDVRSDPMTFKVVK